MEKMGLQGIDGAIFDLDGTIFDSMHIWEEVDDAFIKKHGLPPSKEYVEAIRPMSFLESAKYVIRYFGLQETPEEIMKEWHELALYAYANSVALKPYAREYLSELKKRGIKLAVATALSPELFEPALRNNKIEGLFDATSHAGEVSRGKGYPDLYLLAAHRLGVAPENCAVFEDILAGIQGAKQGGFYACGIYDQYAEAEKNKILETADAYAFCYRDLLQALHSCKALPCKRAGLFF